MIIKKVSFFKTINGMVLWPFLLVKNKNDINNKIFMNHERIHARQQLELLVLPFLLWYIMEYLILRLRYNHYRAYRNIVFEREAYCCEIDLEYLSNRKLWSFVRFYAKKYRI